MDDWEQDNPIEDTIVNITVMHIPNISALLISLAFVNISLAFEYESGVNML